ncbi:arsenate reductase ArsC [Ralstonia sp. 3N]|jgi:protein-tyrosine-phosphatase|uniref:low molecular weight phosphatase family protein n=1 Tax=unclassified Ralstonia TaxID=209769 RepID=UPI000B8376EE|nr:MULTISPECIES: low molecular weight phosphatase family protein [unclassified Ralstonia]MBA9859213.1 arsenate reductase ArsC [Ralstonia insidiosa]MBA9939290.1 arsenate reductase ArsC [Ralstonia insidiosa]MBC9968064.1 arsenate reductase ArsC [Ralstonia insidiosa]MBX3904373.1 arsenate reductase ArsC [Ralstonia insidiosa]NPT52540.1 arsenate reductase ArsC [Ralstonia sp. 3N]
MLSEGMLNHWAQMLGKDVRAYSTGSAPSGRLNPFALEALEKAGVDTAGYRSKSWYEFVAGGAPQMRVVITVCDSAAAEQCPSWPGSPVKVHSGYVDPSMQWVATRGCRARALSPGKQPLPPGHAERRDCRLRRIGTVWIGRVAPVSRRH